MNDTPAEPPEDETKLPKQISLYHILMAHKLKNWMRVGPNVITVVERYSGQNWKYTWHKNLLGGWNIQEHHQE